MLCPCLEFADVEEALLWCRDGITCYCIVTAMDKTEAESRVLQSDASGDARAVSAPVQTRDSARQLELDFSRAGAADGFARPFLNLTRDSFLGLAIAAIRSVDSLLGPAITPRPVRALRTILSFGIVHAFFVGAADDAVSDYGGAGRVGLEEGHDLLADDGIMAHIQAAIGEPALQKIRFVILGEDNGDGDFGGQFVGRPMEGDRSDGIAVKAALGLLGEPGPKWLSSLPHSHGVNALRSRRRQGSRSLARLAALAL